MGETFVLVKPEAMNRREEIYSSIKNSGFDIGKKKRMPLTEDMIRRLYPKENFSHFPVIEDMPKAYFEMFGKNPLVEVFCVSSDRTTTDTVDNLKELIGPYDGSGGLRSGLVTGSYVKKVDGKEYTIFFNGLHSPDKERIKVEREIFLI